MGGGAATRGLRGGSDQRHEVQQCDAQDVRGHVQHELGRRDLGAGGAEQSRRGGSRGTGAVGGAAAGVGSERGSCGCICNPMVIRWQMFTLESSASHAREWFSSARAPSAIRAQYTRAKNAAAIAGRKTDEMMRVLGTNRPKHTCGVWAIGGLGGRKRSRVYAQSLVLDEQVAIRMPVENHAVSLRRDTREREPAALQTIPRRSDGVRTSPGRARRAGPPQAAGPRNAASAGAPSTPPPSRAPAGGRDGIGR